MLSRVLARLPAVIAILACMVAFWALCWTYARADEDPASAAAFWRQEQRPDTAHARKGVRIALRRPHSRVGGLAAISAPPVVRGAPAVVSEARRYQGRGNPTGTHRPWCGDFACMVLRSVGFSCPSASGLAIAYAHYGRRVAGPVPGAIAVLRSHVGFVEGIDRHGNPILISGNHGHRVGVGVYPARRIVAYVMPE